MDQESDDDVTFPSLLHCPSSSFLFSTLCATKQPRPPVSKDYRQSRLNRKNNFEKLQHRITEIESEIAQQKLKHQVCFRCGRSLMTLHCSEKSRKEEVNLDEMRFEPVDLFVSPAKLKGQIWIALAFVMMVIGYKLYGLGGESESISHLIIQDQVEKVGDRLAGDWKQTVRLQSLVNKYSPRLSTTHQKVQIYSESLVAMIQNSKDFATLSSFSGW